MECKVTLKQFQQSQKCNKKRSSDMSNLHNQQELQSYTFWRTYKLGKINYLIQIAYVIDLIYL